MEAGVEPGTGMKSVAGPVVQIGGQSPRAHRPLLPQRQIASPRSSCRHRRVAQMWHCRFARFARFQSNWDLTAAPGTPSSRQPGISQLRLRGSALQNLLRGEAFCC